MKRIYASLILTTSLLWVSVSTADETSASPSEPQTDETTTLDTAEETNTPPTVANAVKNEETNASPADADAVKTEETNEPLADTNGVKKKKKKRKKVRVKARIHTRWEMEHQPDLSGDDETTNEFIIRRTRFKLEWEPEPWLLAKIQVGGFHRVGSSNLQSLLRDAYLHFSPFKYLEIRAGLFKKGFGRLALQSSGKLRVVERGEGNDLILDELRYGGRDIGLQLSGRIVPSVKLDYTLGVFNGTNVTNGDNREFGDEKDIVARLKISPIKYLGVGASGSFKFFSDVENQEKSAWAAGADAVMKLAGFRLHLEGIFAQNHLTTRNSVAEEDLPDKMPLIISGVGILSYCHKFNGTFKLAVEPLFKMEVLDPDSKIVDDEVFTYSPGFNTYLGKYLRLMLHGEFRRPLRNSREAYPKQEKLIIQLCFDI